MAADANPEHTRFRGTDPNQAWSRATGQRHVFYMRRKHVHWLEIEDLLFHHNSAVMMPDRLTQAPFDGSSAQTRVSGLAVLKAALVHAHTHRDQRLLVAGHTDTSGHATFNESLSKQRADHVHATLMGRESQWVSIALGRHTVADYQYILTWIAQSFGWTRCDPQGIDGIHGSLTTQAIKQFQRAYSNWGRGKPIAIDGILGPQTWTAVYWIYQHRLGEMTESDETRLTDLRGAVQFLGPATTGCGEYHPIDMPHKDDYRSQVNRRVELLFYEPGEEPEQTVGGTCHAGGNAAASDCPVYNTTDYAFVYLTAWQARWDRSSVNSRDNEARMILSAPDLAPGTRVTFEVVQDGFGKIGSVESTSEVAGASAIWSHWYAPERVTDEFHLKGPGARFPLVTFRFIAHAAGRAERSATLAYSDFVQLKFRYAQPADDADTPAERAVIVHSPWGTLVTETGSGEDEEDELQLDALPPGGITITMPDYTLVDFG